VSAIVDTHEEAAALALAPLLVRRPLEALLDAHGLGAGPLQAEPIGEGHSNVTLLVRRGAEAWVLRRPPRPPLPPSAHDVLREAWLLQAVEGTPVRAPRVLLTCEDPAVIGAPFYVMELVDGQVITTRLPPELDIEVQRRCIGYQLVDALVELHALDWRACGLEGFGRPTGYLERQLRRFGGLWEHNRTRDLARVDQLAAWLAERLPDSPPATIVHGDYRLGNAMFAHGAPARLVALFDWELATIGDPLADVGYLAATWAEPGDEDDTLFALGAVTRKPGFPTRAQLLARYEERSGRPVTDARWYMTLALWKAAIFLEGNYRRWLAGTTEDPFYASLAEGVPQLAERAWRLANGG
jgi:aminoglycoside phosphotransferase (APT) family kinase protein